MSKMIIAVLFTLITGATACQSQQTKGGTAAAVINTISVDEFEKKIAAIPNAQLIDVRSAEEYNEGHLGNAKNIDINSDDFTTQLGSLDKTKPVLVYCLSGGRSGRAAGQMEELGFVEIYNMDGGIKKWGGAGKPLVTGK